MTTLSSRQLSRATLARQLLLDREKVPAVEAVEQLCAMQAQEPKPPFIGLWTRVDGFGRTDLPAALKRRDLVRATFLRGTLHLLSARDYRGLRGALRPLLDEAVWGLGARTAGLDLARLVPVARDLLSAGPMTFNELRPRLSEAFPDVDERVLGYAVRMNLPLVMVPTDDRWAFPAVASFTLAESWLDGPPSTEDSPEPLVLRYLAAFGPATAADVQAWSGVGGMKAVLDRLRDRLTVFRDERGRELFDLPDAPRPDPDTEAPPRFLPEFDNLMLAHADRTRVLAEEHRPVIVTKNLRVRATFLLDGFVAGTWDVVRKRKVATLRVAPFAAVDRRTRTALAAEAEALLRFVEEDAAAFEVTFA